MNEQLRIAIPVLWPAMATAGAIMLVMWWPRRDAVGALVAPRGWAGALAFGLAFAAAFCIDAGGLPKLPPPEKWQWLLPIAGIACGFGVLAGLVERFAPLRWLIGIVSGLIIGFAFHALPASDDMPWQPTMLRSMVALGTVLVWMCVEGSARRHRGFATPLLLSMAFAGLSLVILHGGSARVSLLTASISASLGTVCVIALLLPPLTLAGGASHVLSGLMVAICATTLMYGNGQPLAIGLIALAPLTLRAGELLGRKTAGWKLFAIRFACVAIPVGAAVILAMIAAAKESGGQPPF